MLGCEALTEEEFFHKEFPDFILQDSQHINELELITVLVALRLWVNEALANKRITILCDNQTSVEVINHGKTRNLFIQSCLREI